MKRLVIELDDTLHRDIKVSAFNAEKTMKGYVLDIIEKEMSRKEDGQDAEQR